MKINLQISLLPLLLLGFSTGLAADVVPLSFRGRGMPVGVKMGANHGIEKIVLKDRLALPDARLARPVGGAFSLEFWIRAESEELLGQSGKWTSKYPMTVFFLHDEDGRGGVQMRLPLGRMTVAATEDGRTWRDMNSPGRIEAGQWYHVVLTHSGTRGELYINGASVAISESMPRLADLSDITFGRFNTTRHFIGTLLRPRIHDRALAGDEIMALAGARPAELGDTAPGAVENSVAQVSFGRYPAMRVADGEPHPLIDQLETSVTVVHWRGPQAADLLVCGAKPHHFGWRPALYRQKGVDHRGLPFYDEGTTIKGLPGTKFFSVVRSDGREELFAQGDGTPYGPGTLVSYTKDTVTGAGFGAARGVKVGGRPFDFKKMGGGWVGGWWAGNIDDDGVPDLLVSVGRNDGANYWPDKKSLHAGGELKNSGKGRGYDLQGEWLGSPRTHILYWAKGRINTRGELEFAEEKPVYYKQAGFEAQYRNISGPCALACVKMAGRPVLLHTGNIDRILGLSVVFKGGELIVEESRPLLEGGAPVLEAFFIYSISVLEEKSDGTLRLLLDGNPGRLVVLEGKETGHFRETGPLLMSGGPLAVDTLATPARHDWDGDGLPDLIIGDAAGWLTLWRGTKDPTVYHAGVFMTSDGRIVHHQAGPSGSIQGLEERRWGYCQPTVGDWDGDGKAEIVTSDTTGLLTLYKATGRPDDLAAPAVFRKDGKPYEAAWRSRPAIIPARMNFGGSGMPALLHTDWDGELAVAIPDAPGSLNIARVVKLAYADGKPIVLCGTGGLWGRVEASVADWDGDGKWDIVFGTISNAQKVYSKTPSPGASPYWLKNTGANEKPVFAAPRPIKLKDGNYIDLGGHTASAWPTDLDGDGTPDLIVGAEDGKTYRFYRAELE